MHEVLRSVLSTCSLSDAGRLFDISDYDVISELHTVLARLKGICEDHVYVDNVDRQTVVEICIARITAAIRLEVLIQKVKSSESAQFTHDTDTTGVHTRSLQIRRHQLLISRKRATLSFLFLPRATSTIETYAPPLVDVLEACLDRELAAQSGVRSTQETPYTKLICDLFSCIFINYSSKVVMTIGVPVAVKALGSRNKELNTKVSCYLAMAAIHNCRLLAQHAPTLITSVSNGNTFLISILPQIYEQNREPFHTKLSNLVNLLTKCDLPERLALLQLLLLVTTNRSQVIIPYLNRLKIGLYHPTTCGAVLEIYQRLVSAGRIDVLVDQAHALTKAAQGQNQQFRVAIVKLLTALVIEDKSVRNEVVPCIVRLCSESDGPALHSMMRDVDKLSMLHPESVAPHLETIARTGASHSEVQHIAKLITERCVGYARSPSTTIHHRANNSTLISLDPSPETPRTLDRPDIIKITDSPPCNWQPSHIIDDVSSPRLPHRHNGIIELTPGGRARKYSPKVGVYVRKSPPNKSRSSGSLGPVRQRLPRGESSEVFIVSQRPSNSSELNKSESSLQSTISGSAFMYDGSIEPYTFKSVTPIRRRRNHYHYYQDRGSDLGNARYSNASQDEMLLSERQAIDRLVSKSPSPCLYRIETTFDKDQSVTTRTDGRPRNDSSEASTARANRASVSSSLASTPKPVVSPRANLEGDATGDGQESKNMVNVATQSSDTLQGRLDPKEVLKGHRSGDAMKQFCEKHFDSIKKYINELMSSYPIPFRCTAEEWKKKCHIRVHFGCQERSVHCLHDGSDDRNFSFKTRNPRTWIHLMFLSYQAQSPKVLSQADSSVSELRKCWDYLPRSFTRGLNFVALATSSFPNSKGCCLCVRRVWELQEQALLLQELQDACYFDLFAYNAHRKKWACFACNHPERVENVLSRAQDSPVLEGQLKEKKGRWKLFKRWRTRYFTLSGATLSYSASHFAVEADDQTGIDLRQVRSVRSVSSRRSRRQIRKAFEIFTEDNCYVLKAKDRTKAEEWIQTLQIAVAQANRHEPEDSHVVKL